MFSDEQFTVAANSTEYFVKKVQADFLLVVSPVGSFGCLHSIWDVKIFLKQQK